MTRGGGGAGSAGGTVGTGGGAAGPPGGRFHADVFSQLPSRLMRELATPEVAALLEQLVAAGWRPGQLRHRVGAAPAQGSVQGDATGVRALLTALQAQPCPDELHRREQAARRQASRSETRPVSPPASPEVAAQHLARLRAQLPGVPGRRPEPAARIRPACSLCQGEGTYFVTREVHLCRQCVAVLAAGRGRLRETG